MKPILFSTPMVKAILEGRKSQTRRIIKPQPIDNIEVDGNFFDGKHSGYVKVDGHPNWQQQFVSEFCRFQIGDILWVRETWQLMPALAQYSERFVYKADNFGRDTDKWRPSIFMPREACRIFLKITNIRVERLQDISEEDAIAEGITMNNGPHSGWYWMENVYSTDNPVMAYQLLWQKINGKESWDNNVWVWVISFEQSSP